MRPVKKVAPPGPTSTPGTPSETTATTPKTASTRTPALKFASFKTRAQSAKVDTSFLDKMEERELMARQARRLRLAGVAGAVSAALGLAYVIFFSPLFAYRMSDCTASGGQSVAQNTICAATASLQGTPLTRLTKDQVSQLVLRKLPQLENVHVKRQFLHGLSLQVEERVVVATLKQNGKVVGVDHTGAVLEVAPGDVEDLPYLDVDLDQVHGQAKKLVEAALVALGEMSSQLRSHEEKVDSDDPLQLSFALRHGRELVWGDAQDSAKKSQVAAILLGVKDAQIIDVSNPDRPSTTES